MTRWILQKAKNQFSELVECARKEGPQLVTRRGTDAVVVMSIEDYRTISGAHDSDLIDFFRQSPLHGLPANLFERTNDMGREISL